MARFDRDVLTVRWMGDSSDDHLHLNDAGYGVMADTVMAMLQG